jgi:hypothetical protein
MSQSQLRTPFGRNAAQAASGRQTPSNIARALRAAPRNKAHAHRITRRKTKSKPFSGTVPETVSVQLCTITYFLTICYVIHPSGRTADITRFLRRVPDERWPSRNGRTTATSPTFRPGMQTQSGAGTHAPQCPPASIAPRGQNDPWRLANARLSPANGPNGEGLRDRRTREPRNRYAQQSVKTRTLPNPWFPP